MIERISFTFGGMGKWSRWAIIAEECSLSYAWLDQDSDEILKGYIGKENEETVVQLLKQIEGFSIKQWKRWYRPPRGLCDGTDWLIKYKEKVSYEKLTGGKESYPENWQAFLDRMMELRRLILEQAFDDSWNCGFFSDMSQGGKDPNGLWKNGKLKKAELKKYWFEAGGKAHSVKFFLLKDLELSRNIWKRPYGYQFIKYGHNQNETDIHKALTRDGYITMPALPTDDYEGIIFG